MLGYIYIEILAISKWKVIQSIHVAAILDVQHVFYDCEI